MARPRAAWTTSRSSSRRLTRSRSTPAPSCRVCDRHQHHHRPGGRGSALRRSIGALMIALTTTSIAWLLFTVILVGWIVYAVLNLRQSRDELGSRSNWPPTARSFSDDEILEGERLTRVLGIGVVLLVVIVIGSNRCTGSSSRPAWPAPRTPRKRSSKSGARACSPPTADGGFNYCAGCHGGMSGSGGSRRLQTSPIRQPAGSPRSTGMLQPSTRSSIDSMKKRCGSSWSTAARSPRCRHGVSRAAAP